MSRFLESGHSDCRREFFPRYPAAERVATYAVLGGVPAYLEQFDPAVSLSANIRRHLFRRTGMFRSDWLWQRISEQFRAFVGVTAFEELCREWTLVQARAGRLPLPPEIVGSHWATDAQVDVAALNWREKAILLGECKWGADPVGRPVIRELIGKAPRVAPGADWRVHYVLFARAGFTDAARAEAATVGVQLVDLETLDADLRHEE